MAGYAAHVGEVDTCLHLSKNLKGRYNLEIVGVEGKMIFGMYLQRAGSVGLDLYGFRWPSLTVNVVINLLVSKRAGYFVTR